MHIFPSNFSCWNNHLFKKQKQKQMSSRLCKTSWFGSLFYFGFYLRDMTHGSVFPTYFKIMFKKVYKKLLHFWPLLFEYIFSCLFLIPIWVHSVFSTKLNFVFSHFENIPFGITTCEIQKHLYNTFFFLGGGR